MVYGTWRIFIVCTSGILALTFASAMFLPESPKFLMAMGKHAQAIQTLQIVYQANGNGDSKVYTYYLI